MAAAFTISPSKVTPEEPDFTTMVTKAQGVKKHFQSLSDTPVIRYKLEFYGLNDADYWTIHNHYLSCYGGYDSFSWQTVPAAYIDTTADGSPDGTNLTGRWVKGSFRSTIYKDEIWNVEITFEKDIS